MLNILYQDDYLASVDKPAGMLVHRTGLDAGETRFVLQTLRDQLQRPVWPVHRLDKGTSGVLLFALDAEVAREMGQQLESGLHIRKTYIAMVRGWPAPLGTIDHPLTRMSDDHRATRTLIQPALTHFQVMQRLLLPINNPPFQTTRIAQLRLEPETGRRHQLRRHMKHIAHPIVGDATHGKGPLNRAVAELLGFQRLWLHAAEIRFLHPVHRTPVLINADAGPEWNHWSAFCEHGADATVFESSQAPVGRS